MFFELVAITIVLLIMIFLVVLILISLASTAGVKVRSDMKMLLRSYDKVIDNINVQIKDLTENRDKLKKEIDELNESKYQNPSVIVKESNQVGSVSIPTMAKYRSDSLRFGYDKIKSSFRITQEEQNDIINELQSQNNKGRGKSAKELVDNLSFDTIFSLSRLSSSEQLKMLDDNLNDKDWSLLNDYCNENVGVPFDISSFWNWLKELSEIENTDITIVCGDKQQSEEYGLEYKEQICEGFQIKQGNRLYDYSIKEREIS